MKLHRILYLVICMLLLLSVPLWAKKKEKNRKKPTPIDFGNVEVVVTATKTPHSIESVPIHTDVITIEEIEKTNAQSAGDILRWLPGIEIRTNGYSRSTVKIHGLPSKYTLVLVDGQRLKGRHADSIDLGQIPVDLIDRIEVVKGPASVLYGSDAIAGVVNIITRSPSDRSSVNAMALYGTGDTLRAMMSYGGHLGRFYYLIGGSKNKSDNMGDGYGYDGYHARSRMEYRFSDKSKIGMIGGYYYEKSEYLKDERFNLNLNWDSTLSKNSYLSVKGFFLKSNRLDARPGRDSRTWDEATSRGEIQYMRLLGNNHLLTLGAESRYDTITYTLIEGTKSQRISSFYAQDEVTLSNRVNIVVAFRMDNHDRWGTVFVPKAGILVRAGENTRIRTSIGKGFVAPTLSQLYEKTYYHPWAGGFWLGGNPDLKPEHSWGYNFDLEHGFSSSFGVRISLFRNDLTDMIASEKTGEYIDGKPVYKSVNIEKGFSQGIEIELSKSFGRSFTVNAGYTFLNTRISSTEKEFPYSPHHSVNFMANYYNSRLGLNFNIAAKYIGSRFTNTSNTDKIGENHLIDMKISKKLYKGLNFFVAVDNLLDEKIEKDSPYFRQGRTYSVGFNYKY